MRFYIESNGCAVLKHETERIIKYFSQNKWDKIASPQDAHIVIMTCCGVTHNEENQAIEMIEALEQKRSNESIFIVGGCLPAFARERILSVAPNARLLTYKQLHELDSIINSQIPFEDVYYNINPLLEDTKTDYTINEDQLASEKLDKMLNTTICTEQYELCTLRKYIWQKEDVYQIKVGYGCPGNCSYCATKLAIGNFHSVPKSLVIKQFSEGIKAGYKHFMMVGDEVGSYGVDFGENIIVLLQEIHALSSDISISIRYIHPDILVKHYNDLKPYFSSGFIDYFCCAIQSASPKILRAMNRNPDIEPFIRCMEDIRKNGYKVNMHTQILVGFPEENEADVLQTLDCLIRCNFDHININKYSPRKGTKSYEMVDTVPENIKVNRCNVFRKWLIMNKKEKLYNAFKQAILLK